MYQRRYVRVSCKSTQHACFTRTVFPRAPLCDVVMRQKCAQVRRATDRWQYADGHNKRYVVPIFHACPYWNLNYRFVWFTFAGRVFAGLAGVAKPSDCTLVTCLWGDYHTIRLRGFPQASPALAEPNVRAKVHDDGLKTVHKRCYGTIRRPRVWRRVRKKIGLHYTLNCYNSKKMSVPK